jgi:photosystem II stability/assembly factor-like uncharacterized protein
MRRRKFMGQCFLTSRRQISTEPLIDLELIQSFGTEKYTSVDYSVMLNSFIGLTYNSLYKSQDLQEWEPMAQDLQFCNSLHIFENSFYINGTNDGLLISHNDGQSFTHTGFIEYWVDLGIKMARNPNTGTLALIPKMHSPGVYVSRDQWHSWELKTLETESSEACGVIYDPINNFFYVSLSNSFFKSTDDGETWTKIGDYGKRIMDLGVFPNGDLFCVFENDNVFKLMFHNDMESGWHNVGTIAASMTNSYEYIFLKYLNGKLFASIANGIQYSTDDGETWQEASPDVLGASYFKALAASSNQYCAIGTDNNVYTSHDGISWSTKMVQVDMISEGLNNRIFVYNYSNVLYTDNMSQGFSAPQLINTNSYFSVANGKLFLSGWYLYSSNDNGISWEENSTINDVKKILFANNTYISVPNSYYIEYCYKSTDLSNWNHINLPQQFSLLESTGNKFIAVEHSNLNVYESSDGESWTQIGRLEEFSSFEEWKYHFDVRDDVIRISIKFNYYGHLSIYTSNDGGVNWTIQVMYDIMSWDPKVIFSDDAILIIDDTNFIYVYKGKVHRHQFDGQLNCQSAIFHPIEKCYYAVTDKSLVRINVTKP